MNYWLMKSEPSVFSITDLQKSAEQTAPWDGVRNYQARNMMRDEMKIGDLAFFYHSGCEVPGIVGIMEVVREGYPDHTAFDPQNKYFDPKSDPANPRWIMVDIKYVSHTKRTISLTELKKHAILSEMPLVRKGNRLSIIPVSTVAWFHILSMDW